MLVHVHQHIWTAPLLDRLAARDALPMIRRSDGLTVLHSAAEPAYVINVSSEEPERRVTLARRDGLDLALIAISSPIGIEALPRDSAFELIDAHLTGVQALPDEFKGWGPVALDGADPDDVEDRMECGCVGISLSAGALAGPDRLDRIGAVLERAAARHAPVLVHPGRAPGQPAARVEFGEPVWWRPLTDYVAQMHAAWLTFVSLGRREHPDLVVVFTRPRATVPRRSR